VAEKPKVNPTTLFGYTTKTLKKLQKKVEKSEKKT